VPPLALAGNLCQDVVENGPPRIGGGPYYCAQAWRALGVRATIFTRCGPAERTALARRLISVGLPVVMLDGTATTSFSFYYVDAATRVMTVEHAGDAWSAADARRVTPGAWVHVAPLLRSDFSADTLAVLARGRRVSFDGQGLVRAPALGPLQLDADFDRTMLRHVHILKLAEEEAEVIGAVDRLGVPEVLVTYGPNGSRLHYGGRWERVGAWPVASDPTGSGDAFSAAYLAGRARGLAPASAARRATALVGAMLMRRLG
jgi:sugar/nucleoside kinase (ribokinase family)